MTHRPPESARGCTSVLRLVGALVSASLVAGSVPSARAEEAPPPRPLSLTISGGGTKGATMAGQLFYLEQLLRWSGRARPRVFTGASAGAINSLIGLLSMCGPAEPDPTRTLYWQAWTTVGLDELLVPAKASATGLLTTDAYAPQLERARAVWEAGLPESCDVLLGIVVTRADARRVVLAPGMPPLPIPREQALLRVTGRGLGRPPRMTNHVDPARLTGQLLLPLDGADARPFDALASLVLASAAFPVGFSPVEVAHCVYTPGASEAAAAPACAPSDAQAALFVDGGVFDNQPLSLAMEAFASLPDAIPSEDRAGLAGRWPADGRLYLLDPRVGSPPEPEERRAAPRALEDVLDVLALLVGLVGHGTSRELVAAFEREPRLVSRLELARSPVPELSSTFTGLLDQELRELDFTLGMVNAEWSARHAAPGSLMHELARAAPNEPPAGPGWRRFRCLGAVLAREDDGGACAGAELTDFRILIQLTLDRLALRCRAGAETSDVGAPGERHALCEALAAGAPIPQVAGVRRLAEAERTRRPDERDLDFQLRLLGRYGFHFADLGLARDEADEARVALIRRVAEALQAFADLQPRSGWAAGVLARIGVDLGLGYVPPEHSLHVTLGEGLELGYSVTSRDPGWSWLRFGVGLGVEGLGTLLDGTEDYVALIPKLGPELELYGHPAVQVRLGLRVGWQLSTGDGFSTRDCDFAAEARLPCSRLVTEIALSASLVGLVRLQLAGVIMPPHATGQELLWAIRPSLGFQLNSPF